MARSQGYWSHGPYENGRRFCEMLEWHLLWGTRAGCSKVTQNKSWKMAAFAEAVHVGMPPVGTESNSETKLRSWRQGAVPDSPTVINNIFQELFGDDPNLSVWKEDLTQALAEAQDARDLKKFSARKPVRPVAELNYGAIAAELGIRRELLEVLALRFGHESPDESDVNLLKFLKRKAVEYHQFKSRLSSLSDRETHLQNLLGAANDALDNGNFLEVENLLSLAEDRQNEETISSINKQAEIRISRGDAAHIVGDSEIGIGHYEKAVSYFAPFSTKLEVETRIQVVNRALERSALYEIESRVLDLINPAIEFYCTDSLERAEALYLKSQVIHKSRLPLDFSTDIFSPLGAEESFKYLHEIISLNSVKNNLDLHSTLLKDCALVKHALGQLHFDRWRLWPSPNPESFASAVYELEQSLFYADSFREIVDPSVSSQRLDYCSITFGALSKLIVLYENNPHKLDGFINRGLLIVREVVMLLGRCPDLLQSTEYHEVTFDAMCEILVANMNSTSWHVLLHELREPFEIWNSYKKNRGLNYDFKGWEKALPLINL